MKSAAGFLSVWFSLFARLLRPFSCLEARGSSYFPSEHTMYPPAFFSLCVRNSFLLRFFCAKFFFRSFATRKLPYKVLVIQCIIIRRCIFGRFICICRLVCGITEEWIGCRCHIILCGFLLFVIFTIFLLVRFGSPFISRNIFMNSLPVIVSFS